MRECHGKRTHGLAEVLAVTVCVEHLTVPPHQEQAVIVGSNPRRWKRTGLHGVAFAPSLMDLRHKAGLGEARAATMQAVVLVVACDDDEASTSMLNALLKREVFTEGEHVESSPTYLKGRVRVWSRSGFHLDQDHLDRRWTDATGRRSKTCSFCPSTPLQAVGLA